MAIWSSAGSIISCELPQERKKKNLAYHLSFVITHPSRATDTHIKQTATCADIGKPCMHQHLHAHLLLFPTCAKASPSLWLSVCLLQEGTFTFCVNSCGKYAKVEMNGGTAGEQTVQKYKCCFSFSRALPACLIPAQLWGSDRREEEDRVC